jgi:hypothetical protein
MSTEKLSLAKEAALTAAKSAGIANPKAKVVLCIDYSGSMDPMYSNGFVQSVFERIVPLAMAFTPEKSMPCYIFGTGYSRVLPDVTAENVHDYVDNNIRRKYSYGTTEYSPVIRAVLNQVIKDNAGTSEGKPSTWDGVKTFFGGGPKKPAIEPTTAETPTLVVFITDGDANSEDKSKATAAIIEAAKHSLFFQFIGLGHSRSENFAYLKKLDELPGRFIDNANFFPLGEDSFKNLTDEELYSLMLVEFPSWYKEAQTKGIFKIPVATTA